MTEHCPSCNADFDGGPIQEDLRKNYSPPYHWSRKIGVVKDDKLQWWKCPDCGYTWDRTDDTLTCSVEMR